MIQTQFFKLKQVRLLDGLFHTAMRRDMDYLLSLDADRFLHTFRITAGLPTDAKPYGGWEAPDCELRGHSLGHYLSACSLVFASTDEAEFKRRVDYIIGELEKCQDAMPSQGYNDGYLSAYPESFFDRVDRRESVWAPYYTLHKIMAGLLDAYTNCGSSTAFDVLNKLAQWLDNRTRKLSVEQMQISILNEPGGITETLAQLYALTRDEKHLDLLLRFNHELVLNPLANGEDQLDRQHANTQIPKATGTALQYEATGDENSRKIAEFFWETVAFSRSYAIGGNSDDELFFPIDRFAQHLSSTSAESCNTYNMLKLTRHIFSWQPSTRAMDFYERGLFNHILGSQDPETSMMTYFISHKPGHVKLYNTPENSFWCCTGTGMENHVKYTDTIYAYDDDSLYINLFIASELNWSEKGLIVRQETQFPEENTTHITINTEQPIALALKIRYPSWANSLQIKINGQLETIDAEAGSYIAIDREWQDGDHIDVQFQMGLHIETLPNEDNIIAFLYGPIVLVGARGTEDMPDVYLKDARVRLAPINFPQTSPIPVLTGSRDDLIDHIEAVDGQPLTFKMNGNDSSHDVDLIPFYRLHHQRYTIYWKVETSRL